MNCNILLFELQCFFCRTESDFNDLCQRVRTDLIDPEKEPMFEVSYNKPKEWSPTLENAIDAAATSFSGIWVFLLLEKLLVDDTNEV